MTLPTDYKRQIYIEQLRQYNMPLSALHKMSDEELLRKLTIKRAQEIEPHPFF